MSAAQAAGDYSKYKLNTRAKFIIATAVMASLLEIIDTSIVNVAIPSMMGNLGATLEDISWVVTGYIIANAIVLPISAWLGSQFGRRKYYIACILAFTITSVSCGLAPNLETLVIFRILQGLAGGALLPTSQALLQEQFPRERSGTASAIYGMSVMIGPTLGPTMGGFLTDHFNWRAIFNINLPLGIFAAFMAYSYVTNYSPRLTPEGPVHDLTEEEKKALPPKSKIDSIGLALLCAGIGCLQFVLERGQADSWFESTPIIICSIIAALSLPGFIWWELKIDHPIINLRLFKIDVVRNGTALMSMLGFMLYGVIFVLPVFMGRVLHFDATQTGMMFIPGALITAFCMPIVGKAMQKFDPRILILTGTCIVSTMLLLMTQFSSLSGQEEVFWSLIVRGLGMAFLFVPINAVVLGQFRAQELGQVAGLMNLLRQLGGSVGIALIGTLLERNSHQNRQDLANHVSTLNAGTQYSLQKMGVSDLSQIPSRTLQLMDLRLENQVFLMSFTQMMWYVLLIYLLSLIPLYFLKRPAPITKESLKEAMEAH
ncbi:MAG: DHA2 family efflux MFS transporter permease subunit [Bdellovibrionales bacterium]|nr:DHA2 family efflux MFS transporter permease subunit [Bdellovibrionales bacterium]